MPPASVHAKFTAALDALVETIKADRTVLAVILCGSLSHDTVWAKSDIDLVLVTVDDNSSDTTGIALDANGVNVHAWRQPRAAFRKTVEGAMHSSFTHALLARGRLLYTHDPTIGDLVARLAEVGARDVEVQLLEAATEALPCVDKARKWLVTRGDLDYAALWILYAATALARIEVIGAGRVADREVIPQALALNPTFFRRIYTDLLNQPKTPPRVEGALDAIDAFLIARTRTLFRLVVDYLREAGEPRASSEIDAHFKRHFDVSSATTACEYLVHRELVGQAAVPAHLTKKSRVHVQELAFYYLRDLD
jgi:uncharacterized protein